MITFIMLLIAAPPYRDGTATSIATAGGAGGVLMFSVEPSRMRFF